MDDQQLSIDPNKVIELLTTRISALTLEIAVLTAAFEQMKALAEELTNQLSVNRPDPDARSGS